MGGVGWAVGPATATGYRLGEAPTWYVLYATRGASAPPWSLHASDDTRAPPRVGPARRRALVASRCSRRRGVGTAHVRRDPARARSRTTRAELPPARAVTTHEDEKWDPRGGLRDSLRARAPLGGAVEPAWRARASRVLQYNNNNILN
jgi:hypothetical protein